MEMNSDFCQNRAQRNVFPALVRSSVAARNHRVDKFLMRVRGTRAGSDLGILRGPVAT